MCNKRFIDALLCVFFVVLLGCPLVVNAQGKTLVVVVNNDNPLERLSKKEVIDIYMGRFSTFPHGEPVEPMDFPNGNRAKQGFYQQLLGKSERKVKAYWSRLLFSGRATPPTEMETMEKLIQEIKQNPKALAYLPADDITPEMKIVYQF